MNILTQSIAITDSIFNFDKFGARNAITFDLTEIERKKNSRMKFCCASNAAIKKAKIARKNQSFSPILQKFKIVIFSQSTDL